MLVFSPSPEPDSTLFPPLCVHFSRASQLIPVNTRSRILAWRLITEIANRLRRRYASSLSPEPRQSIKINILIRPVKAFCTVSRLGNTHASEQVFGEVCLLSNTMEQDGIVHFCILRLIPHADLETFRCRTRTPACIASGV